MERENFTPNELTGQGQNTYSSGMAENTGEFSGGAPQQPRADNAAEQNSGTLRSPEPTPDQVQEKMANWERFLASQGQAMTPETRQTVNMFSKMGLGPQDVQRGAARPENVDMSGARMAGGGPAFSQRPENRSEAKETRRPRRSTLDSDGERDEGVEAPDPSTFTDPDLKDIATRLNSAIRTGSFLKDPAFISNLRQELEARGVDPAVADQMDRLTQKLDEAEASITSNPDRIRTGVENTLRLTLTNYDFQRLREDPVTWLNDQLDKVYELSTEGQELSSQSLRDVQSLQGAARRYIENIGTSPEVIKKFDQEFLTKLNIMYARNAIQQRNLEGITGIATQMGAHGLINSLSFENGMVGMMFNRIQDLYDDVRVRLPQHHITPEEHSKIQKRIIDEFSLLAETDSDLVQKITSGVAMSDQRRAEVIRAAITRSVRTGYDHFVASQREGVIVARGESLLNKENLEGILADPSGLFQMFNFEQMLFRKFSILNEGQNKFLDALKRDYALSALQANKEVQGMGGIDKWVQLRIEQDPSLKVREVEGEHGGHGEGSNTIPRTPKEIKEAALISYGEGLFRDMMLVNDFYSSGWRVEQFTNQIGDIIRYKKAEQAFATSSKTEFQRLRAVIGRVNASGETQDQIREKAQAQKEYSQAVRDIMGRVNEDEAAEYAKNFGLFLKLRAIETGRYGDEEKKDAAKLDTWQRIAKYRPEDVIKIFREKGSTAELVRVNEAFENMGIHASHDMTNYDAFKDEYGAIIKIIREKGFARKDAVTGINMPEQIDFSQINSNNDYKEYRSVLVEALVRSGKADSVSSAEQKVEQLARIFKVMKDFAGDTSKKGTIYKLIKDVRFDNVYRRAYALDDALLDRMENVDIEAGMTQVSRRLANEPGGDAFKRAYGDAAHAQAAHSELLNFLRSEGTEEKLKASLAAAESASNYAGTDSRAKIFRYTFGSYMIMGTLAGANSGKFGTVYEILDMKSRPGRKPVNELQKIFGPQAPAFNNDEMLHFLDEHRSDLEGVHGAEMYEEMKRLSRTGSKDRSRFMLYRFLVFAMIWLGYEVFSGAKVTFGEGLQSDELK